MSTESGTSMVPAEDWKKLVCLVGADKIPMPSSPEIFLLECHVAGTMHVEEIFRKTEQLGPGSALALLREPENPYDRKAILVLTPEGDKIGYIPRTENNILSRLMDAGKLLFARVEEKYDQEEWVDLEIRVYLRDL